MVLTASTDDVRYLYMVSWNMLEAAWRRLQWGEGWGVGAGLMFRPRDHDPLDDQVRHRAIVRIVLR